jgi:hypothetical protein
MKVRFGNSAIHPKRTDYLLGSELYLYSTSQIPNVFGLAVNSLKNRPE